MVSKVALKSFRQQSVRRAEPDATSRYGFGFFPKEAPASFPKTLMPAHDPDESWHIPIRRKAAQ